MTYIPYLRYRLTDVRILQNIGKAFLHLCNQKFRVHVNHFQMNALKEN